MPEVIAFRSDTPTHRFLSNFRSCPITFAGYDLRWGAEQAYVLSNALLVVPKIDHRDRRRETEVNKVLQARSALDCKRISREIKQRFSHEHAKFVKIQEHVMHSVLIAKFSQNEDLRQRLLQTGNAILVEANAGDDVWGCGMSYDQVHDAVRRCEEQGRSWLPSPYTNLLGRLLMRVRAELQGTRPSQPIIYIGDSLAKRAQLNCATIIWAGAKLDHILALANIIGNLTISDIIIGAGTNSLTRAAPWEGLPPDSHDGAAQRANLGKVIEHFQDRLDQFQRDHPNIRLHITEIPFRWCDPPRWSDAHVPAKTSRVQNAVSEMNQVFLQTENQSNGRIRLVELYYELFHPNNFENVTNEYGKIEKGLHFSRQGVQKFSQVINTYIGNMQQQ